MRARPLAVAALIVLLLALPFVARGYFLYLTIQILILSVFALGFNLLFGYTGLLSFGQAGFFAVGAYACAKILMKIPSLLIAVPGAAVTAAAVALVLGALSVRHTRIYFSMLTLAFGMMIYSLAWKWRDFTGGDDGLVGVPRGVLGIPGVFSMRLSTMDSYYFFVLIVAGIAVYAMYRLVRSPLGLALRAIRDSEQRAAFAGLSVSRIRLIAFAIAGFYAGLAGALLPPLESTVTPLLAHWSTSAEPVLATLLGGIHTFAGPIVGAALLILIKDIIVRFTIHWSIVLGVIVVILVMGFRGGVVSMAEAQLPRIKARRPRRSEVAAPEVEVAGHAGATE